jgi:hypothetical protein
LNQAVKWTPGSTVLTHVMMVVAKAATCAWLPDGIRGRGQEIRVVQ